MEQSPSSFVSRYFRRVRETKSILCVGLDIAPDHVPPIIWEEKRPFSGIERYLTEVIEIAAPLAPVVKFQFAYYAALGIEGLELLEEMMLLAKNAGLLVILDAKRADIGETMERYGEEVFGVYNADACTFVPYLGETFNPVWLGWLKQGRMVIPMIRTSNPEAAQLQDLELATGPKVYEHMAQLVASWNAKVAEATNGAGAVGGVVGATWPEQAKRCRELAGDDVFFLIPGYGAQGGGAQGAIAGLMNSKKTIMGTVNSSRGITLFSWFDKNKGEPKQGDSLELVEKAIKDSNLELNSALLDVNV